MSKDIHSDVLIFLCPGESKGRPDRREGNKVSGGHFVSPWESPLISGRIREDVDGNQIVKERGATLGASFLFLLPEGTRKDGPSGHTGVTNKPVVLC